MGKKPEKTQHQKYMEWLGKIERGAEVLVLSNGSDRIGEIVRVSRRTDHQIILPGRWQGSQERRFRRETGRELGKNFGPRLEPVTQKAREAIRKKALLDQLNADGRKWHELPRSMLELLIQVLEASKPRDANQWWTEPAQPTPEFPGRLVPQNAEEEILQGLCDPMAQRHGQTFCALRRELNLPLQDTAKIFGVEAVEVSELERGLRRFPSREAFTNALLQLQLATFEKQST